MRPWRACEAHAAKCAGTVCRVKVERGRSYKMHGSDCVLGLYQLYDRDFAGAAAFRRTNK